MTIMNMIILFVSTYLVVSVCTAMGIAIVPLTINKVGFSEKMIQSDLRFKLLSFILMVLVAGAA